MVNKALNLVYLTLISTYPSFKTKKGHLRHLHAEAQSEIIHRNHFENNSARYFGYKLKVYQTFNFRTGSSHKTWCSCVVGIAVRIIVCKNDKLNNVDDKAIDFKTRLNVASLISPASDCAVSRASIEKISSS